MSTTIDRGKDVVHLNVINDQDIESIHETTLRILSEIGVNLTHPEGRAILTSAGATLKNQRVLLPPNLVERFVAMCPREVKLLDRTGNFIILGDGGMHWHNLGGAREVYEPDSGQRRAATLQDVRDSARILDALDQVTTITPFFTPKEIPGEIMALAMYRHTIPQTTKLVHGPGVHHPAQVDFTVRLASVLGKPEEMLSLGISPISPLFFPDKIVASIIQVARSCVTLTPLPCPTAGATAPLSLAGALAQQNAEVLAVIFLAQIVNSGTPIIYCGRLSVMEPRSGASVWGGVELGLLSAATVQIAHRYNIPVNVYGLSTNALIPDVQNGFERALNACLPAIAGADELSGIGEMNAGIMGSYLQMVIDNEIAGGIRRLRRGFNVDEDSLAFNVMGDVLKGPGNFLADAHTVHYLRSGEVYVPELAERRSWLEWERSGRESIFERAHAETERLLFEHHAPPLTQAQEDELDAIMEEAGRYPW